MAASSNVLVYSARNMRLWRGATRLKLAHVGAVGMAGAALTSAAQVSPAAAAASPLAAAVIGLSAVGCFALGRFAQRVSLLRGNLGSKRLEMSV